MRYWPGDVVAPTPQRRWFASLAATRLAATRRAAAHAAHRAAVLALATWGHRPRFHTPSEARHIRALAGLVTFMFLVGTAAIATRLVSPATPGLAVAAGDPLARLEVRGALDDTGLPGDRGRDESAGDAARPPTGAPGETGEVEVAAATLTRAPSLLPAGKGMWFHHFDYAAEGRDPAAIVARASAAGLSHLYVRLGSSRGGFYAQGDLDRLLPAAHQAGLEVVGWDFPYLADPIADAERARAEIAYRTPDGYGIDAFSADIETPSEGVQLAADRVDLYGAHLREAAGPTYPLIATVPNPGLRPDFPYAVAARHFDAFAPMIYWIHRDPVADLGRAMDVLSPLGRPVLPIGQAFDPAVDGGPPNLVPSKDDLSRFMAAAAERGAVGISFWVWHLATPDHWAAITEAPFWSQQAA